jgi:hypothetical protein
MVKRIASAGVVGLVLLGACAAVGQSGREALPDAPSAVAGQTQRFETFAGETRSPLSSAGMSASGWSTRQEGLLFSGRSAAHHKDPDAIFRKYLNPSSSSVGQASSNHAADGGSVMGRATHAASRTVVTRNESGKGRLNTSYLLRALTSVAKDTASTPYWRRSATEPFSDFGSTVGSDAGRNLWHEFGPGIERLAKNHTPTFISKIEERIGHK